MLITEQNYLKILQGVDITLSKVCNFLLRSKNPIFKDTARIQRELRVIVTSEMRRIKREKYQKLREEQIKTKK